MGSRTDFDLQMHLTALVGWGVNTIGKALVLSMIVALVFAGAMVVVGLPPLAFLGGLVGPLVFGLVLYLSEPPLPRVED